MSGNVTTTKTSQPNGTWKIVTDAGSGYVATQLVSHDGGSLIGQDGSTIVASGGGNFSVKAIIEGNERKIKLGKSVLIIRKK